MPGSADGTGSAARFDMPHALVFDGAGNLYVADTRNHTIRKMVIATGAVSTYAGNPAIGAVQLGPLPARSTRRRESRSVPAARSI